jgi:uncharacterized protein (DUF1778 family)
MTATALARAPRTAARRQASKAKAPVTPKGDAPLSMRVDSETRSLIDRAATALGQTRTEFMLASARERATEVLLNRTLFVLKGADWNAFVDALDNPPPPNAKLKALLARRAPWETESE